MARIALSDEEIDKVFAANGGEGVVVETVLGTAVFRAPTPDEYRASLKMVMKGDLAAAKWLASKCVLSPDGPTFERWCTRRPGIPKAADGPLTKAVGLDEDAAYEDAEDGDTVSVVTIKGPATFKCPDELQWDRYRKMAKNPKDPWDALTFLATACVVSPPRAQFQQWLEEKPGIAATVAPHIQRIAGIEAESRGNG